MLAASQALASNDANMLNRCSITVSKSRSLLLDKFMENDIELVKKIKNYLIEKSEEENCISLYPREYSFILYSTAEYEELLNNIKRFETRTFRRVKLDSIRNSKQPIPDILYRKLKQKSGENAQKIKNQIYSSNLDAETKDFLALHFEHIIKNMPRDSLNALSNDFLNTYPNSEYKDFIRKNNREENISGDLEFNGLSDVYGLFVKELITAIKILFL